MNLYDIFMVKSCDIYGFLNQYIDSKLMLDSAVFENAFVTDQWVEISGHKFSLNCWKEVTDKAELVCVELSRSKMFFGSEAYSLAVLFSGEVKQKLSQQELWDMGF